MELVHNWRPAYRHRGNRVGPMSFAPIATSSVIERGYPKKHEEWSKPNPIFRLAPYGTIIIKPLNITPPISAKTTLVVQSWSIYISFNQNYAIRPSNLTVWPSKWPLVHFFSAPLNSPSLKKTHFDTKISFLSYVKQLSHIF